MRSVFSEEILVDEIDGYECKNNGIDPTHHCSHNGVGTVAPPSPIDFSGDVEVEDEGQNEKSPPRTDPKEEKEIERGDDSEEGPLSARSSRQFEHKSRIYRKSVISG